MISASPNLVNLSEHGIRGSNYYWTRRDRYNLSLEELRGVGVTDGSAYVDASIIEPLKKAQMKFKALGYELIIKDAYRSPELYQLVQKKLYTFQGKESTDRYFNAEMKPHSNGRTVDVSLAVGKTGQEIHMRNSKQDSEGAQFIDFYKEKTDTVSREFQRLQDLLIQTMLSVGFRLGVKREFWHFEYPAS